MNLSHIVTGWSKSLGVMKVNDAERKLSEERMNKCAVCPFAKESSFLKLFRGKAEDIKTIYCRKCGCPVNEKTLVAEEQCPENKW